MEYRIRKRGLKIMFECPKCKLFAHIDKDQYEGRISIRCPRCKFHETINLKILGY